MIQVPNNEANWEHQVADAIRIEKDFFGKIYEEYHSNEGPYKPWVVDYSVNIATVVEALIDTYGFNNETQFARYCQEAMIMAGTYAGVGFTTKAITQFLFYGRWKYWKELRAACKYLYSLTYNWPDGRQSFDWLPDKYAQWRPHQEYYMNGMIEQSYYCKFNPDFRETAEACAFQYVLQNALLNTSLRNYASKFLLHQMTELGNTNQEQNDAIKTVMTYELRM